MIDLFNKIGKYKVNNCENELEEKNLYLESELIYPSVKDKSILKDNNLEIREIVINLKTNDNSIEIKWGQELTSENIKEILPFKQPSNSAKKIFSTNNVEYHIASSKNKLPTVPAMIKYIKDKFDTNQYRKLVDFLKEIREKFYVKWDNDVSKDYFLNISLLEKSKVNIKEDYTWDKVKNIQKEFTDNITNELNLYKKYFKRYEIFSLKIDDEYIQNLPDIGNEYIEVVYYDNFKRYFKSNENKQEKICSQCGKRKDVTGKIDLKSKFYQTTNDIYFENLKNKNSYKSFSLCRRCFKNIFIGNNTVLNELNTNIFNVRTLLIPHNYKKYKKKMKNIIRGYFINEFNDLKEEIDKNKKLIEFMKSTDTKFDFLFYEPEQSGINVIKHIKNIYFRNLNILVEKLSEINEKEFYRELENRPSITTLRFLLFPSYYSHNNVDLSIYKKELTDFLDRLINFRTMNFNNLVRIFLKIFKKRYFKNNKRFYSLRYIPIQMNILLTWLKNILDIKGGRFMEGKKAFTEISDKKIVEFFNIHKNIYENSIYNQGLVLLGTLINKILNEQKEKSSNFLNKINFDGIPARRVQKLLGEVIHYLDIYDQYDSSSVKIAETADRLQGIKESELTKDEVLFYILSGISLGRYLAYKGKIEKEKGDK